MWSLWPVRWAALETLAGMFQYCGEWRGVVYWYCHVQVMLLCISLPPVVLWGYSMGTDDTGQIAIFGGSRPESRGSHSSIDAEQTSPT